VIALVWNNFLVDHVLTAYMQVQKNHKSLCHFAHGWPIRAILTQFLKNRVSSGRKKRKPKQEGSGSDSESSTEDEEEADGIEEEDEEDEECAGDGVDLLEQEHEHDEEGEEEEVGEVEEVHPPKQLKVSNLQLYYRLFRVHM
jgi:hypothetical protein